MKFTVFKDKDMDKYLHPEMKATVNELLDKVQENKYYSEGKKPNTYLVINKDEPYADEVINIMKRHGHWG